ncbi:deoxyguanosinetriphosphate triphosphohydrolase-like domain protein, partial [Vibrio parahaemolyticus V-223/04]
VSNGKKVQQVS